jgi:AmmeMemoRadiSam system protein A
MSSSDPAPERGGLPARLLVDVARASIRSGVERGRPLHPDPAAYPEPLRAFRASFVTLELEGTLRGCMGGLEPTRPLVRDVAEHAFAAAFRDPRFPPLAEAERARVDLKLSILSPLEALSFASEQDLLSQLRPGVDGVLLEAGRQRGTFLPAVWEQLPDPREFLRHLKRKAGLGPDFWSADVAVHRYTVESIDDDSSPASCAPTR